MKNGAPSLRYLYTISVIAAFGGFTSSFSMSLMTGSLPFIVGYFGLSDLMLGITSSSLAIGAISGAILTGSLPDKIGRKRTMRLAAILYLFSTLMVGFSFTPYDLILYRIITGFAVGMTSIVVPMYLAEIAPPEKRGVTVTFYQMAIVIAIMIGYITSYLLSGFDLNWRLMLGAGAIPSVIFLVILSRLPESPRWLINHSCEEKGRHILIKINGATYANEMLVLLKTKEVKRQSLSFNQLFRKPYLKVLIVGSILTIIQQWTGTNLIFIYSPFIFQSAGFDVSSAVFQTIFIGIVNFLCTIISLRLIERFGRKTLLILGLLFTIISLLVIAIYFQMNLNIPWLLVSASLFCVAAFAMTLGPVMWIVIAEISPSAIRSQAMSVFIFSLWVAGMLSGLSFPILKSAMGPAGLFYLYTGICIFGVFFISRFIPETKDKPLEEIEKMWLTQKT